VRNPCSRGAYGSLVSSFDGIAETNPSDSELLAAHIAGDRYAFEKLFHRHHRQLYRLAMTTSRNPDDAADALQDALLSAHRTAASFRWDAAVSSWLYRIVVNACLDRLRRNKSHLMVELIDDAHTVGDHTPRVDTAIMVERALMRLPLEQRAAVVAVDMQGYSVAETARMLGVAQGTVKSRCSRARAKLAEALGYFDTRVPATACGESPLRDAGGRSGASQAVGPSRARPARRRPCLGA
jgi:RNA polymerase sigma-70 factor, ECF subfamily